MKKLLYFVSLLLTQQVMADDSDKTKQLYNQFLQKLLEGVDKTTNFVGDQAPLITQEIVRWGLYCYGFNAVMSIVIVILSSIGIYKSCRSEEGFGEEEPSLSFFVFLMSMILFLVFGVIFLYNMQGILFVMTAPRLYIIEQIKQYIN